MKCLIVAAGQGTRLRAHAELKPLIPICGASLIERVIANARSVGINDFVVVTGYHAEDLQAQLLVLGPRLGVDITSVHNPDWTRANGISVQAARPFLSEPFLLAMCDHLMDPEIVRQMITFPQEAGTVVLGVDFNIDNPLNDPEDVTRVKCDGERLLHIGKVIRDFNCFDTGIFRCTPVMFDGLAESQARGDDSISGAMNVLAGWEKARVLDIGDRVWVDVDDPIAFEKAEALLDSGRL
jgi:1L-myo-inositol 1-phosphate cytidylyltransferase